jgi:hypothetical protein
VFPIRSAWLRSVGDRELRSSGRISGRAGDNRNGCEWAFAGDDLARERAA